MFFSFYFLCSLTGQLTIIPSSHKDKVKVAIVIWTLITTAIFLPFNLLSLVFDVYIIAWCPYKYCGYISIIQKTQFINLTVAQNITNESDLGAVQTVNLTIFDDWQKTVLTTANASGTISYLFMICVVLSVQYFQKRTRIRVKSKKWMRDHWMSYGVCVCMCVCACVCVCVHSSYCCFFDTCDGN